MRENETSLRKLSGGTAQLRTLEGTLVPSIAIYACPIPQDSRYEINME